MQDNTKRKTNLKEIWRKITRSGSEAGSRDIFLENERLANNLVFIVLPVLFLCSIVIMIFFYDVYSERQLKMFHYIHAIYALGWLLTIFIRGKYYKYKKYALILILMLIITAYGISKGDAILLLYLLPIVVCCRYYDRRFLNIIGGLTVVMILVAWFGNAILGDSIDLNATMLMRQGPVEIYPDEGGWFEHSVRELLTTKELIFNNMCVGAFENLLLFTVYFVSLVGIRRSGTILIEKGKEIAGAKAEIEGDLNAAARIQHHMLPESFEGFEEGFPVELYGSMKAAYEVGGDLFDFFELNDGRVIFLVGDVSGKGVPASLFMSRVITCIRLIAEMEITLDEMIDRINQNLSAGNTDFYFVTMWIGILDKKTGLLEYVNAGHNPPLISLARSKPLTAEPTPCAPDTAAGKCAQVGASTPATDTAADGYAQKGGRIPYEYMPHKDNIPIGISEDFHYESDKVLMRPGDSLFIYTDGVTESTNVNKELYGEERLEAFMNAHGDHSCKDQITALMDEIAEYSKGAPRADDITMLSIRYNGI